MTTKHKACRCSTTSTPRLSLLSSSLADLGRETSLDSSDGTSGTARVASDKVKSVLSLVEFGVRRTASFAGDVFDCR